MIACRVHLDRRVRCFLLSLVTVAMIGCTPQVARVGSTTRWGPGHLPFTADWFTRGHGVRDSGLNNPATVHISSSSITIRPYYDGHLINGGAASTATRFDIRGAATVTAQLRACVRAPLRTSIWLQSPDNRTVHGVIGKGREIDIAEIYTANHDMREGYVAHNLHFGGYERYHRVVSGPRNTLDPCTLHTYTVHFDSVGYDFYVDGALKWTTRLPGLGAPEYLIFSVEVPSGPKPVMTRNEALGYAQLTAVTVVSK